jgi:hypothetical protein
MFRVKLAAIASVNAGETRRRSIRTRFCPRTPMLDISQRDRSSIEYRIYFLSPSPVAARDHSAPRWRSMPAASPREVNAPTRLSCGYLHSAHCPTLNRSADTQRAHTPAYPVQTRYWTEVQKYSHVKVEANNRDCSSNNEANEATSSSRIASMSFLVELSR